MARATKDGEEELKGVGRGGEEVGRATTGRAEELKGASRDEGEWLEGVGRGGERETVRDQRRRRRQEIVRDKRR
ncbi:hypothetical protein DPX16_8968 [Anabarilius grahami]|uniref:Uncharacterized protein n=1 Tax=Anabarilius grahami TaxID=495550 RepID=A0A3N0XFK7_ANAGA|nr:hypothetical protein DPX16_8968 [Anabarilius grahami]